MSSRLAEIPSHPQMASDTNLFVVSTRERSEAGGICCYRRNATVEAASPLGTARVTRTTKLQKYRRTLPLT